MAQSWPANIESASSVALALSVWLFYLVDRWLDGLSHNPALISARHVFYRRQRRPLAALIAVVAAALTYSCTRLSKPMLVYGTLLGVLAVLYLFSVHVRSGAMRRWYSKELAVGVIFAMGTSLAPWAGSKTSFLHAAAAVSFAMLCTLNCAAIEVWESSSFRVKTRHHALTAGLVRRFVLSMQATAAVAFVLAIVGSGPEVFAALTVSALGFLAVHQMANYCSAETLRLLIDLPLLSPIVFLTLRV